MVRLGERAAEPLAGHMSSLPESDRRFTEAYSSLTRAISEDHRGTPEAPGRVVTLITRGHWETLTDSHSTAPPRTWGAAYHIPQERVKEVREYLDIREINGYSMHMTDFHVPVKSSAVVADDSASYTATAALSATEVKYGATSQLDAPAPIRCLVYIGLPDNPQFLGPQDPDELARHIVKSKGPSGENKEYVYKLAEALEGLRRESGLDEDVDEHVFDLAQRLRKVDSCARSGG